MGLKEKFDLTGRRAVVTGGARGIGQACAEALAEYGVNLAIADILEQELAETTADLAKRYGVKTQGVVCDVTDSAAVDKLVEEGAAGLGGLDIFVNSVGITIWEPSISTSDEQWNKVINTNLNAAFYQSRAAGRQMLEQGQGSIIHIASMSGSIVNQPQAQTSYNASKAGLMHMVRSLAAEWASRGVRINTLSPGYTLSVMTYTVEEHFPYWNTLIPMGRMAEPEELVGALIYLASDAASYTTGHDLVIDGGYTCW
ncbi:MAG: SDR family oxidoreductase [candidate division WS1 bacterium]|nr:SDR family oxidoreductase [candidate division WS1 bacterium]